MITDDTNENSEDPGSYRRATIETSDAAGDHQEDILRDIVSERFGYSEPAGVPPYKIEVGAVDLRQRRRNDIASRSGSLGIFRRDQTQRERFE
jgi:hypothetical protein